MRMAGMRGAEDPDLGHARQVLQPVLDEAVGVVGDLDLRLPVRRQGQIDDRLGVGLDLGDDRLVDLLGQAAAGRETRSRTSPPRQSWSRSIRKRTLIWLRPSRLCETITSTPSMPESTSSSGWVTWLSMISGEAPRYSVVTETTGSSMLGYSRTGRRL